MKKVIHSPYSLPITDEMGLKEAYIQLLSTKSDIYQHLPTLQRYGKECSHITEFGVRGGCSTIAFFMSKPEILISYDIEPPNSKELLERLNPAYWEFIQKNVLEVIIDITDLLFIDSKHTYDQLSLELFIHSPRVKRYIILHDTVSYGFMGEDRSFGLLTAAGEFLLRNPRWRVREHFENNNGLSVLERMDD